VEWSGLDPCGDDSIVIEGLWETIGGHLYQYYALCLAALTQYSLEFTTGRGAHTRNSNGYCGVVEMKISADGPLPLLGQ